MPALSVVFKKIRGKRERPEAALSIADFMQCTKPTFCRYKQAWIMEKKSKIPITAGGQKATFV